MHSCSQYWLHLRALHELVTTLSQQRKSLLQYCSNSLDQTVCEHSTALLKVSCLKTPWWPRGLRCQPWLTLWFAISPTLSCHLPTVINTWHQEWQKKMYICIYHRRGCCKISSLECLFWGNPAKLNSWQIKVLHDIDAKIISKSNITIK